MITTERFQKLVRVQGLLDQAASTLATRRLISGDKVYLAPVAEGLDLIGVGKHLHERRAVIGDRNRIGELGTNDVIGVRQEMATEEGVKVEVTAFPYAEDIKGHPAEDKIVTALEQIVFQAGKKD